MIHWEYIKGAYRESGVNNPAYTFIDFYGGPYTTPVEERHLPKIYINDTNQHPIIAMSGSKDAGHIVTSDIAQTFKAWMTFTSGIYTNIIKDAEYKETILRSSNHNLYIGEDFTHINIGYSQSQSILDGDWIVGGYLKASGATSIANPSAGDIIGKAIYSDSVCEAQYFNSTSDRRAKTDIKPISKSVLPIVMNTQLYSFKYKDLDTPSIGIIAQDIQDIEFDGFSIVDNKEATGQNMDYMSIHESKLVYILWKAIQEQQKEIEELKSQIKKGL